MKIFQSGVDNLSIVPETDFEKEHLGKFFHMNEDRNIVVKFGDNLLDIVSVDIVVTNIKCPITIPDPVKVCGCNDNEDLKPCSCATEDLKPVKNSLINLVKE